MWSVFNLVARSGANGTARCPTVPRTVVPSSAPGVRATWLSRAMPLS